MAKKSVLSEDSKKELAKARDRARQEAKQAAARRATGDMVRRDAARELAESAEGIKRRSAAVATIRAQARAVAASWGVRPHFAVSASNRTQVRAWTDFRQVVVDFPIDQLPTWNASTGEWQSTPLKGFRQRVERSYATPLSQGELFLALTSLLGAIYHEVGHVRFTIPFHKLLGDHLSPVEYNHQAWNILEDQRMERAVVADSAIIGRYLAKLAVENISDYLLVIGRDYLSKTFRQELRAIAVEQHGEERVVEAEGIVWDYIQATTRDGLLDAVKRLTAWMAEAQANGWAVPQGISDHWEPSWSHSDSDGMKGSKATAEDGATTKSEDEDGGEGEGQGESKDGAGQGQGGAQGKDEGKDEGDDQPGGKSEGESQSSQPGNGAGANLPPSERAKQAAKQAARELNEELLKDEALNEKLNELSNEMADTSKAPVFPEAKTGGLLSGDATASADRQINAMVQALEVALSEGAPHWTERQREGVLNPLVYRTRQPGDREFYRAWTGDEDPGANIVVTLVLDCSGSMMSHLEGLGQAAWVTGQACKRLGVTYRAFNFGSDGYAGLLYEYSRESHVDTLEMPLLPADLGGTQPERALRWVSTLDTEGKQHLVIVMTDGQFMDDDLHVPSIVGNEATVLGIGYSSSKQYADYHAEALRRNHGFRHAIGATSLSEIPRQVENFLRRSLVR